MNGRGFTMNELLVTISLIGILALLIAPDFRHLLDSMRLRAIQADLHASLLLARQEAMTRGRPVVVRNIQDSWDNGWQVFIDTDNNARPGAGDLLLLEHGPLPPGIRLSSNFGHYARYKRNGRTSYASGAFMAGTWLLCSTSGSAQGRKLVMSYGGRLRRSSKTANACPL